VDSRDAEEITNNGKTSIFGRTDGGFSFSNQKPNTTNCNYLNPINLLDPRAIAAA